MLKNLKQRNLRKKIVYRIGSCIILLA